MQRTYDTQLPHLLDLHCHVEDLDNFGHRHNIRLRGIPEVIESAAVPQAICSIFNDLLGCPADSSIEMERAHRALRSQPRDSEPPRDVMCCIANFPLKEEILCKARERGRIMYNGTEIKLFQDLSQITLQNIQYRWKFPFGLSASARGRSAMLCTREDLQSFCDQLDLPQIELLEWYAFYFPSEPEWCQVSPNPSPKAQRQGSRRHRLDPISPEPRSTRRNLNQRSPEASGTPHRDRPEA